MNNNLKVKQKFIIDAPYGAHSEGYLYPSVKEYLKHLSEDTFDVYDTDGLEVYEVQVIRKFKVQVNEPSLVEVKETTKKKTAKKATKRSK